MNLNIIGRRSAKGFRLSALFAALFVCGFATKSHAQFSIEVGGTYILSSEKSMKFVDRRPTFTTGNMTSMGDTSYYAYDYSAGGGGILVYPKFNFVEVGNFGLSLGVPVNLAFSGSTSTGTTSFLIDASAMLDINGGNYNDDWDLGAPFGWYAGIGYGITNTSTVSYSKRFDNSITAATDGVNIINSNETDPVDMLDAKTGGFIVHAGIGRFSFAEYISVLEKIGFRVAHRFGSKDRLSYTMVSLLVHL